MGLTVPLLDLCCSVLTHHCYLIIIVIGQVENATETLLAFNYIANNSTYC